jgi:tRNA threonylcarbamoyladenosine biosynthesis protein TsaB
MMKILGIDTSTAVASVALVEDGKLALEEVQPSASKSSNTNHANHAEILLPLVERVLNRAALSLSDISAIAVSIGPGSFTGLRIGLSTAKGLAYGWDVPIVGVPTLLAIAARVTDWEGLICPFLDARKEEVYAALFNKKGDSLERLTEDRVSLPKEVIQRIQFYSDCGPCLLVGDGTKVYGELIKTALREKAFLTLGDAYPSTASAVARLGEERLRHERPDPLGPLTPVYLRPSEAELKRARRDIL